MVWPFRKVKATNAALRCTTPNQRDYSLSGWYAVRDGMWDAKSISVRSHVHVGRWLLESNRSYHARPFWNVG